MQSRIVAAVAMISVQRQKPVSVRTRVTSASLRPAVWACGSSNTTLAGAGVGPVDDTVDIKRTPFFPVPIQCFGQKLLSMPAFESAAARAFIQAASNSLASAG